MRLNSGAKSRLEQIAHHAVSVFLKHEGTKHGVLYLGHMGLQLAKFIDHLRLVLGARRCCLLGLFFPVSNSIYIY